MSVIDKIEKSLARKDKAYWAEMRSTLGLLQRSKMVTDEMVGVFLSELGHILVNRKLIYPPLLGKLGITPEMSYQDKKKHLKIASKSQQMEYEQFKRFHLFIKDMQNKAANARKTTWQWRVAQEAEEREKAGWYPFFITLTIDPSDPKFSPDHEEYREGINTPQDLWEDGREFRKFIRRLVNVACEQLGHRPAHKKPYRPESDYVRYAGVIEHGKSREHHHGHFLVWIREIKPEWKICPNKSRVPHQRTVDKCLNMEYLWPWSQPRRSTFQYFRSSHDIWSRLGFVLPLKDGKPLKIAGVRAAGRYITKYLQKDHKQWNHRMKATRNLGLATLKNQIARMDDQTVLNLTWRPQNSSHLHSVSTIHSVPLALVRSIAKQEDYLRRYRQKSLDLTTLMTPNSNSYGMMLMSVQHGARPDRMDFAQYYDWVCQHLPEEKGYCEQLLQYAHKQLSSWFPTSKHYVKPQQLSNDIGHLFGI
jgi:hypothetical protein